MLELGILKTWNADTHKAGVQLVGSLTTYLDNINVAINISPQAMVLGNYVLVAIPGGNPRDACVVASWPAGSSGGGGGGGTKIQDADADTSWDVEQTADEDKVHGKVKGVEAFLLDDAGILTLAKQSAARAYKSAADQDIANGTVTKVVLDAESYDLQGEFDNVTNYRFTAKTAGLYLIIGQLFYTSAADRQSFQCRLHKNGAEFQTLSMNASGEYGLMPNTIAVDFLAVNDYLELYTAQFTGGSRTLLAQYHHNWLTVAKIA